MVAVTPNVTNKILVLVQNFKLSLDNITDKPPEHKKLDLIQIGGLIVATPFPFVSTTDCLINQ